MAARRDHRSSHRRQGDAGDRLGVPPGARSRDDAPAGRSPSRHPAARYRRKHLARHHRDLHVCAGAVFGACRPVGGRCASSATPRAFISASRCRSFRTWARRAWSRRCPTPRATLVWYRPSRWRAAALGGARWSSMPRRRSSRGCRSSTAPIIRPPLPVFVISRAAADAMVTRGRGLEHPGRRLEHRGGARTWSARRGDRGARPRFRRRGTAGLGAAGRAHRPDHRYAGHRPARRCAPRPSSAATPPAIGSRPRKRGRSRPAADPTLGVHENVRTEASATAPRRARYRGLCAGQEHGARASRRSSSCRRTRRRWGRARRRSRRSRRLAIIWRTIRRARRRNCAKRSAAPSASIRTASSAAPAPTICSI